LLYRKAAFVSFDAAAVWRVGDDVEPVHGTHARGRELPVQVPERRVGFDQHEAWYLRGWRARRQRCCDGQGFDAVLDAIADAAVACVRRRCIRGEGRGGWFGELRGAVGNRLRVGASRARMRFGADGIDGVGIRFVRARLGWFGH
jgi:hypothetical protein